MLRDTYHRPMTDLRISVTDRCNFRCTYCMPFDEYVWIDKQEILTFEEITRLTGLFIQLGVEKVRLTGGEPLVRRGLDQLVGQLSTSVNYRFIDGSGDIGVIASVTEPFCSICTRARLTADGKLVTCLFSNHGHDLKMLIRTGATDEEIIGSMSAIWRRRWIGIPTKDSKP
jgi:molybdenum cofactor biosynthesis enzyme MoaA